MSDVHIFMYVQRMTERVGAVVRACFANSIYSYTYTHGGARRCRRHSMFIMKHPRMIVKLTVHEKREWNVVEMCFHRLPSVKQYVVVLTIDT